MNSPESVEPLPLDGLDAAQAPAPARPASAAKKAASRKAPAKRKPAQEPAAERPIARVCVDLPLPHLDRPFDYLVPAKLDSEVVPGGRVRVRFAGQLVDAYVLDRVDTSDHGGRLAYLERAVSDEPVIAPEIATAARAIADRYAGTLADVLRLAIPPRHARAEDTPWPATPGTAATPRIPGAAEDPVEGLGEGASGGPAATAGDGSTGVAGETGTGGSVAAAAGDGSSGVAGETGAGGSVAAAAGDGVGGRAGATTTVAAGGGPGAGGGWGAYVHGPAYLAAVADGRSPRAVWSALPGEDWPARLADVLLIADAAGRGAVAVVPDARDLDRLDAALEARLGPGRHVTLSAALGPQERYRRWLAVRRGDVRIVAGTRAASFAPVTDLGVVAIWDDGDDLHNEPRAPYCHAREVLLTRAQLAGAAALVGAYARTCEAQLLLATGWAQPLVADRTVVRDRAPRVTPLGEDGQLARDAAAATARLPSVAWQAARASLAAGAPVLVQVPRRGYMPSLSCTRCRAPARCTACGGPLSLTSGHAIAGCRWCGHLSGDWACGTCGGRAFRAGVIGARRTADELGRAFPQSTVRTSGRDAVLSTVPAEPALVVATPGAEPVADGGYGAALLLDTWALLTRADLRASEEALRRWANAAALVRPANQGGQIVVTADAGLPVVQSLMRWDFAGHAERELAERAELGFPPAVRMASVTGSPDAVADLLALADLPPDTETLGPVPIERPRPRPDESATGRPAAAAGRPGPDGKPQGRRDENEVLERSLLRVPRGAGRALAAALHAALGVRSARKAPDPVRVEIDPIELF